jgi:hypothetical protein
LSTPRIYFSINDGTATILLDTLSPSILEQLSKEDDKLVEHVFLVEVVDVDAVLEVKIESKESLLCLFEDFNRGLEKDGDDERSGSPSSMANMIDAVISLLGASGFAGFRALSCFGLVWFERL